MLLSHAQLQNELTQRLATLVNRLDTLGYRLCNNYTIVRADEVAGPITPSLLDELTIANGRLSDEINNLEFVLQVVDQLIGPTEAQPATVPEPIPSFLRKGRDILGEALDNATDERTNG